VYVRRRERERVVWRGRTKPQKGAARTGKKGEKGGEKERLVELLVARHYPTMHS